MPTITGVQTVNDVWLICTDTDPTTGAGVTAPIGSVVATSDGSGLFYKTGAGDTAYSSFAPKTSPQFVTSIGIGIAPTATFHVSQSVTASAWTTNGIGIRWDASSYTDTSSSGTVANMYIHRIGIPTLLASSATTYTNGYTLWIEPPTDSTNVTTTNKWALGTNGNVFFNIPTATGGVKFQISTGVLAGIYLNTASPSTTNYTLQSTASSANTYLNATGTVNLDISNVDKVSVRNTQVIFTPSASATASTSAFTWTSASSITQTLSTNVPEILWTMPATKQWATGTLANQDFFSITQPTIRFVGASTGTLMATLTIGGAVASGTNATLTETTGILIKAGAVAPTGTATTSYGMMCNAQTGATTNYSAKFLGGLGVSLNHLVGNTTAPTIGAGAGAGTTPTVSLSNATDLSGIVNVTTGTVPTGANAIIATITFNTAYGVAPNISLTPANAITALLGGVTGIFVTSTTTTFVITSGTTALTASTAYSWFFNAMQ